VRRWKHYPVITTLMKMARKIFITIQRNENKDLNRLLQMSTSVIEKGRRTCCCCWCCCCLDGKKLCLLFNYTAHNSDRPKPEFEPKPKYRNFGLVWTETETETERQSIPKPKPKAKIKTNFISVKYLVCQARNCFVYAKT
jgi:hypothetical protein